MIPQLRLSDLFKPLPAALLAAALFCTITAGWQAWHLHSEMKILLASKHAALARAEGAEASLAEARSELTAAASELAQFREDHTEMADRIHNLEVQRDHLRADIQRRQTTQDAIVAERQKAEELLEACLVENLALRDRPQQLHAELETCTQRLETIESSWLADRAQQEMSPALHTWLGTSADTRVFAIQPADRDEMKSDLPMPVLIGHGDNWILNGKLLKQQDDMLVGLAEAWHQAPSALVNGQKVFILPLIHHETPE